MTERQDLATPPAPGAPEDAIPLARQIAITTGDNGHVFLHLVDADGRILAAASLTTTQTLELSAELLERARDVLRTLLTQPAGTA